MKAQKCTLVVNNRWGYVYTPVECNSINEAYKKGREDCGGFAFRIFVDGKVVKSGYCDN